MSLKECVEHAGVTRLRRSDDQHETANATETKQSILVAYSPALDRIIQRVTNKVWDVPILATVQKMMYAGRLNWEGRQDGDEEGATYDNVDVAMAVDLIRYVERAASAVGDGNLACGCGFEVPYGVVVLWVLEQLVGRHWLGRGHPWHRTR